MNQNAPDPTIGKPMTNANLSTQPLPPVEPATDKPAGGANSTPGSEATPGPKQSGPPSPEPMSQDEKDLLKVLGERRLSYNDWARECKVELGMDRAAFHDTVSELKRMGRVMRSEQDRTWEKGRPQRMAPASEPEAATDRFEPQTGVSGPVQPSPELPAILGELETLTDTERVRYQACEAIVATGWQNFVDVGLALAEIRRDRLYKEEYDSFEVYCREKWHYGRRHVYQLISAAELFTHLCAICAHCKPDHESQLRPLVGLTPEQAQLAWTCAVESAGGRKITARLVKKAMQDLGLAAPPKPVSKINRNAKAERRKLINDTIGQLLLLIGQKAAYEAILQHVEALQRHIQPLLAAQPRARSADL
ncbi:MAG: hypothetical protein AB9869_34005 [Verrucomicrobiia bacterium]